MAGPLEIGLGQKVAAMVDSQNSCLSLRSNCVKRTALKHSVRAAFANKKINIVKGYSVSR